MIPAAGRRDLAGILEVPSAAPWEGPSVNLQDLTPVSAPLAARGLLGVRRSYKERLQSLKDQHTQQRASSSGQGVLSAVESDRSFVVSVTRRRRSRQTNQSGPPPSARLVFTRCLGLDQQAWINSLDQQAASCAARHFPGDHARSHCSAGTGSCARARENLNPPAAACPRARPRPPKPPAKVLPPNRRPARAGRRRRPRARRRAVTLMTSHATRRKRQNGGYTPDRAGARRSRAWQPGRSARAGPPIGGAGRRPPAPAAPRPNARMPGGAVPRTWCQRLYALHTEQAARAHLLALTAA